MTDQIADQWVIARDSETGEMEFFLVASEFHDELRPILSEGDTMPEVVVRKEWKVVHVFSEDMTALLSVFSLLEIAMGTDDTVLHTLVNEAITGTQKGFS